MMISQFTNRFSKIADSINSSFWFIPSLCIILAFAGLAISYLFDQSGALRTWPFVKWLYTIDPEGARLVLSTIASATITVTSIAFSMIVVTLTLASSQFGPRLLRTFMQNRTTQIALGIFVATFVFCLSLIRFVRVDQELAFVPGAGLTIAIVLCLVSIFMLVFLIHQVAISIQADNVIERCWQSLHKDIHRMFPAQPAQSKQHDGFAIDFSGMNKAEVVAPKSGFVQLIDYDGLTSFLSQTDSFLQLDIKAGDYVSVNAATGSLYSIQTDQPQLTLNQFIVIGHARTPIQDPEFAIHQLVELGLRALSPSINDPFTAIICLKRLGSALGMMANRHFPSQQLTDQQSVVRLQRKVVTYKSVLESACNQLRQNCLAHPSVIIAFLEMLTDVASHCGAPQHHRLYMRQGTWLLEQCQTTSIHASDMQDIQQRYSQLQQSCEIKKPV